jgi:hypothetical protein
MKKLSTILVILFLTVFSVVGIASATPTLWLTDGTTSVTIADGGGLDLNPVVGAVTFSGSLGNFNVNVTTGITHPIIGSPSMPQMDLNSVNVSSQAGGSLDIYFSEVGFSLDPSLSGFFSSIGGTTDGIVSASSYLGSSLFDLSTQIGALGPYGPIAFSEQDAWSGSPTAPFSLTLMASINHTGFGQSTSFDFDLTPIPEPATMILLGTGLIGLAGIGRKKFIK